MIETQSILITGANGLLGRRVAQALSLSHEVHALVRSMPVNRLSNVAYHAIDLSSDWDINALPHNIDTIFHLSQSQKFRDFPEQALDVFKVNVDSTARLLDFAQKTKVKRFIYGSSGGVYGTGASAFTENSPIHPDGNQLGYYLGSKLCSEILVKTYSPFMVVSILRFFFMYGKEQNRSMLLPRLVDSVIDRKPINIQGANGILINPVYVDDAVHALSKIIYLDQSCLLNIAGPDVLSIRDIACIIGKAVGKEPVFNHVEGDPKNLIADIDGMRAFLCAPKTPLEQGILELLDNRK